MGIAFLLKEMVGPSRILEHEIGLARGLSNASRPTLESRSHGPATEPRFVDSVVQRDGLHDFVSTLLDHLFGIQNRSGCSCAGPYGHRLLGIQQTARFTARRSFPRPHSASSRGGCGVASVLRE